ncbi:hypothetical protein BDF14DRAFT_1814246 [Spinellus fusiger]|nr:hypothetical protein BDF14DRAFT_1814246 [Spinellus fusiger]
MTSLVSHLVSQADRLPLIGSHVSTATQWISGTSPKNSLFSSQAHQANAPYTPSNTSAYVIPESPRLYAAPPPPYEKEASSASRLTQISDYVWKRASFSAGSIVQSPFKPVVEVEPITMDKKQIDHGLTLIQVATEMDQAGNHTMAADLYLMGLERMLCALPLESDPKIKQALEKKLVEFKETKGLNLQGASKLTSDLQQETEEPYSLKGLIINAAILSAVALKRSPLPDVVGSIAGYCNSGLHSVDETYQIRKRAWGMASQGVAKAVEMDQSYQIHQMFTEAVYIGCTALLKAGIAYTETPGYKESRKMAHQ